VETQLLSLKESGTNARVAFKSQLTHFNNEERRIYVSFVQELLQSEQYLCLYEKAKHDILKKEEEINGEMETPEGTLEQLPEEFLNTVLIQYLESSGFHEVANTFKTALKTKRSPSKEQGKLNPNISKLFENFESLKNRFQFQVFQLNPPKPQTSTVGTQSTISGNLPNLKRKRLWDEYRSIPPKKVKCDPSNMQIRVEQSEVQQRLTAFLEFKKEENNLSNNKEFIESTIERPGGFLNGFIYKI